MAALKPCLGCGVLSPGTRCKLCKAAQERARDAARAPRRAGRYGSEHQAERTWWQERIDAGVPLVTCRRGLEGCLMVKRFGPPSLYLSTDDSWDLGHPDALCAAPTAPEHERCNRHYAGVLS